MISIGITGGIGSGKSMITQYLNENYKCRVLIADELAKELQEPGGSCYMQLVALLGKGVLDPDGRINRKKMSSLMFPDPRLVNSVNKIVHPAVKKYITNELEVLSASEDAPEFYVVEAALLLEEGYDEILDDMWYIYTDRKERMYRLMSTRGMPPKLALEVMDSQLPDEVFRERCSVVIDNSREPSFAEMQADFRIQCLRKEHQGE